MWYSSSVTNMGSSGEKKKKTPMQEMLPFIITLIVSMSFMVIFALLTLVKAIYGNSTIVYITYVFFKYGCGVANCSVALEEVLYAKKQSRRGSTATFTGATSGRQLVGATSEVSGVSSSEKAESSAGGGEDVVAPVDV